ncbi:MAG: acyl carrier protein [Deltaproteobacteria bacterium]|nr:acyl carrier protein [Deltaproteobacteria bacterium]
MPPENVSREAVYEKVRDAVIEVLGLPPERITPSSRYLEDLGATSLDMATMLVILEQELDIRLPVFEARALATLEGTVEFIMQRIEASPTDPA